MELLRNPVFMLLSLTWIATVVGVPWALTLPVTTAGLTGLQMAAQSERTFPVRHGPCFRDGAVAAFNSLVAATITILWGAAARWLIAG